MTDTYNFFQFQTELCASSDSPHYSEAVNEWSLSKSELGETGECICGKSLNNLFYITNEVNNNELIVGSACVKKFLGENDRLMKKFKRLIYNQQKKKDKKLYRKCDKCFEKYDLMDYDDHDILLECNVCNRDIHIKRFNDLCDIAGISMHKCIDCGYRFNLKNNKWNSWQIRCIRCYRIDNQ